MERGALKGLLTKKDLWCVLSCQEGKGDGFVAGVGVLREEGGGSGGGIGDGEEERGLLGSERGEGRARSDTVDTLESR